MVNVVCQPKLVSVIKKQILYFLANGNDNKKFKGDRPPCSPSRVLHLRKIPSDVTEAEVISLGLPFGKVTNLLMLKGKSQVCKFSRLTHNYYLWVLVEKIK